MEVSSSTTTQPLETGKDPLKKSIEVQEQQVSKIIEGLDKLSEQTKQINAQKSGIGTALDLLS